MNSKLTEASAADPSERASEPHPEHFSVSAETSDDLTLHNGAEPSIANALIKKLLPSLFALAIFALAVWFIYGEVKHLEWSAVAAQADDIPLESIVFAILFSGLSYFTLTMQDTLAVRYLAKQLSYPRIAKISFIAMSIGHNVGAAAVTGGAVRLRLYSRLGFTALDVAKIVLFCSTTFICGAALPLGLALMFLPSDVTAVLHLAPEIQTLLSVVLIAIPLSYVVLAATGFSKIRWRGKPAELPTTRIALGQVLVGGFDLIFVCCCLYSLLAPELTIAFPTFLGIYLIAVLSGIFSSVPGGIGVFEAVLLFALPTINPEILLGTVLVYRVIYYLAPLFLALLLLAWHELKALHSDLDLIRK